MLNVRRDWLVLYFILPVQAFPLFSTNAFCSEKFKAIRRYSIIPSDPINGDAIAMKENNLLPCDRRNALIKGLLPLSMLTLSPGESYADEEMGKNEGEKLIDKVFLNGKVDLKADVILPPPEETTSSALYITARPNKPDNVPRAILDGSNGKPPPVLATRIANPSFPFNFALTARDLTPEGGAASDSAGDKGGMYWFENQDLIVSARWDTDGIAASRDPTDLVGRTMSIGKNDATLTLSGRGFTGKLVTNKSKP